MSTPEVTNETLKQLLNQDEDAVVRSLLSPVGYSLKLSDLAQLQELEWLGENRSRVNDAIQSLRQVYMEDQ